MAGNEHAVSDGLANYSDPNAQACLKFTSLFRLACRPQPWSDSPGLTATILRHASESATKEPTAQARIHSVCTRHSRRAYPVRTCAKTSRYLLLILLLICANISAPVLRGKSTQSRLYNMSQPPTPPPVRVILASHKFSSPWPQLHTSWTTPLVHPSPSLSMPSPSTSLLGPYLSATRNATSPCSTA